MSPRLPVPGGPPRLVVAAPASGHGKTTVATGLIAALRARGLRVSPHKVGPDYIDPGYHALAAGRPARNLDAWMTSPEVIAPLFLHGAADADIAVVEGVMGLFDGVTGGADGIEDFASTAHVARLLDAPVLLVVDAAAQARSVAALVHGFATFDPAVRIGGVVLNRVGSDRHEQILRDALAGLGVPVLGAIRREDKVSTPSRHLGLVPVAERATEAVDAVAAMGDLVARTCDLEAICAMAATAPRMSATPWDPHLALGPTPRGRLGRRPRIAIAGGPAFTFSYAEHVELLVAAGADVVTIDPLRDESLPTGTTAFVVGGGFPEIHAAALSENERLRKDVADLAASGGVVVAECAGLLYLARELDAVPMCGVLDVSAVMTPRLTLGYREAVAAADSVLCRAGTRLRGHEFHRTVCEPAAGADGTRPAWTVRPSTGGSGVAEGHTTGNVHASYLHLHWAGRPRLARRIVEAARRVDPRRLARP
ncbi:cobyrinate a,c-diamide synthase [Sporichthya brevicatena]|uniref:Hydrogenobyrinate a,c-diamide synthase n=1 Tax=Sporichthya brevicatena TaxID=171442 RepID=A0ABP3S2E0_9ACTN